ncbi:hypothetical protein HK102_001992 [Quaeritorhiza haematococci]|nr:hypothetical protein HK102_001992 [Quaeritorhiza haematococci]
MFPPPLSKEDVEYAFAFLTQHGDAKKVTTANVGKCLETYFPSLSSTRLGKVLSTGKEEFTRDHLVNLLVTRAPASTPFQEGFQFFEPQEGVIPEKTLMRLICLLNPHHLPYKGDMQLLLKTFDQNGDGVIDIEDFKRMGSSFSSGAAAGTRQSAAASATKSGGSGKRSNVKSK